MTETEDYDKTATPTPHKATHQNGGADEIVVTGLSGLLADAQTPLAHNHDSLYSPLGHLHAGVYEPINSVSVHNLLFSGVHGVGASTVASVANITTHANLNNLVHGVGASGFEDKANKGVASGYCELDASVLIPLARIPTTLTGKDADTLDTYHAASFSQTSHNHSGIYEPVISAGSTAQYWRGDKSWQTLNQAAVAGLTTTDTPQFKRLGIGSSSLSNVANNVGGTITSPDNAFGVYMGGLTLTPANGWSAFFGFMGSGAVAVAAGETVPSAFGEYIGPMTKSGTGTINASYGLYIEAQAVGATNWGVYVAGNNSYFGGDVWLAGVLQVDGIQVVSNRVIDSRIDDTIGSTFGTTEQGILDACRDALITHGLCAAA